MGQLTGILGQVTPTLNTDTALYTVPAGKFAEVKVIVANRAASDATIRIWVAVEGAATSDEQYLAYDESVTANKSYATASFSVKPTDVVRVRANSSTVSFTCTGI